MGCRRSYSSFALTEEKRLTLVLSAPVAPKQIEEIAYLVTIGLILGFVVRGGVESGLRLLKKSAEQK